MQNWFWCITLVGEEGRRLCQCFFLASKLICKKNSSAAQFDWEPPGLGSPASAPHRPTIKKSLCKIHGLWLFSTSMAQIDNPVWVPIWDQSGDFIWNRMWFSKIVARHGRDWANARTSLSNLRRFNPEWERFGRRSKADVHTLGQSETCWACHNKPLVQHAPNNTDPCSMYYSARSRECATNTRWNSRLALQRARAVSIENPVLANIFSFTHCRRWLVATNHKPSLNSMCQCA